eukprot:3294340-Rhodomonas_salina.1
MPRQQQTDTSGRQMHWVSLSTRTEDQGADLAVECRVAETPLVSASVGTLRVSSRRCRRRSNPRQIGTGGREQHAPRAGESGALLANEKQGVEQQGDQGGRWPAAERKAKRVPLHFTGQDAERALFPFERVDGEFESCLRGGPVLRG